MAAPADGKALVVLSDCEPVRGERVFSYTIRLFHGDAVGALVVELTADDDINLTPPDGCDVVDKVLSCEIAAEAPGSEWVREVEAWLSDGCCDAPALATVTVSLNGDGADDLTDQEPTKFATEDSDMSATEGSDPLQAGQAGAMSVWWLVGFVGLLAPVWIGAVVRASRPGGS